MTKWLLYIIFIKPGFMATAYTSYWSLESCMAAADLAERHHQEVNFVTCIPESRATETFFATQGDLGRVEEEIEEVEEVLDGDPDL